MVRQLITYSEALTLIGVYVPFTEIGGAVLRMLADTLGALAAGWQAGMIMRSGNAPLPIGPQPTYTGNDLAEIADQLIARQPG